MNNAFGHIPEDLLQQAQDAWEFKTCQRRDGSVYGIPDKSSCETGKEVSASHGNNIITDMRIAAGKDPDKLNMDVLLTLGPDALLKVYKDNAIDNPTKKQRSLKMDAKNHLRVMRLQELDEKQAGTLGFQRNVARMLADAIVTGETAMTKSDEWESPLLSGLEKDLENQIRQKGVSLSITDIRDGLTGVQQLLANPEYKDVLVKRLKQSGIRDLDGLGYDIFSAAKVAALVGGLAKTKGMTSQQIIELGMEKLTDTFKYASIGS